MSGIPFPGAQAARDPITDPWPGDVWQKGARARRLLGFCRRVPCRPYRSYGRTLEHRYEPADGPADATHVEINRLLSAHAPKQTGAARRTRNARNIGGVPFRFTSSGKISIVAWLSWLPGARLLASGRNPDPPVPPWLARRGLGVLLEERDGDTITWTFEWGSIVATRLHYPHHPGEWWSGDVLVGGVPVGTWDNMKRGSVLDICWGYAQGIMVALQRLDESDHAMIRLGLEGRKVVRPDFRRDR